MKPTRARSFVVQDDDGHHYGEILRVTNEGEVYMRTMPEYGRGQMVRVLLSDYEIARLRDCEEMMDAIEALCGIIARLARPH